MLRVLRLGRFRSEDQIFGRVVRKNELKETILAFLFWCVGRKEKKGEEGNKVFLLLLGISLFS